MGSVISEAGIMAADGQDQAAAKAALNETLKEYINEWRKTREKEEEELKKLKEKQAKRKEIRAEQEKKLNQQKKEEEEKLRKDENEKKAKRLRRKRSVWKRPRPRGRRCLRLRRPTRLALVAPRRLELEEEKKIALSIRIKPLDLDSMDTDDLKDKAKELFNIVIALETDKYDYEQRRITQDYELNELKERQKAQLRQKALKKGLDPEAFSGKYPPPIRMYSKYERRTDTRTYEDRKKLYEGGWEVIRAESLDAIWKEKYDEWSKRPAKRLPKWFGERPGKKAGDAETPEGEEAEEAAPVEEEEEFEEEE